MDPQSRTERRSRPIAVLRAVAAATLVIAVSTACAWDPWIPGEKDWNPEIVVKPGDLSKQLPLDTRYVDTLDCYASTCEKRFRVVVEEPGELSVTLLPELSNQDSQARLVLESLQGVLARAATGRGPRDDVVALTVGKAVDPGMYFVLIQSVGGRLPYQLTAQLRPGDGAAKTAVAPEPEPLVVTSGPPPKLVKVPLPGTARGGYDPAVDFASLRTFSFRTPADARASAPAGTAMESPIDLQIRRFLADELTLRGLRQATGDEPADLIVDFSRSTRNRPLYGLDSLYAQYDFGAIGWGRGEVDTRGTLRVDLIDGHSNRIAWHGETTKAIGPGIVASGDASTALVRESVNEALAGFPPR